MKWKIITLILLLHTLLFPQYYFGQNKIQPYEYDWDILQTPHFDIYYYSAEREIAEVAWQIAERTYARYTRHFNYSPPDRIPIVLYSSSGLFSETHTTPFIIPEGVGGFTEFVKGRVILPYDFSLAKFKHILSHELVHIWQLHYCEFLHDAHELFFIDMPPLWFTEGQAELLSEPVETHAERTELIAALANDRFVMPQDFSRIYGTYQMYKEGENFLRFLGERFGSDVDVKLFEKVWEHRYFGDLFRITLGVSIEEAGLLWRDWLWRRFGDYIARRTPERIVGERITGEGMFFSPVATDSGEIICKGNFRGYAGLYRVEGGKVHLLRRMEFTESAEATRLFGNRIDVFAGTLAAFSAKSLGKDRIIILNLNTGRERRFQFDSISTINSVSFSGDGTELIFSGAELSGFSDIWKMDINSGELVRLTDDHYYDADPVFTGKGEVIFVSDRRDERKMGLFLLSDGEYVQLLASPKAPIFRPSMPAISDDGRWLTFVADDDTFPDAYILDLETDSLWRATRISQPIHDVRLLSRSVDMGNLSVGLPCCTLLVSVSTGDGVAIKSVPVDSVEFLGVFGRRAERDFWVLPRGASTLASIEKKSKPSAHKLSFDLAQGAVSTSSAQEMGGGLEVSLSDMMGDNRLYIFFLEAAQRWEDILSDANIIVAYDNRGTRWSKTVGAYHLHISSYDRYEGLFDERQAGVLLGVSYALSRFMRVEGTGFAYFSDRMDLAKDRRDGILSLNISLIRDNSLWGVTGPVDGMRMNFTVGAGGGFSGRLYHYLFSLDFRHYLRLSKRVCWAHRIVARHSDGEEPKRFYMGGTWDFRGYPYYYFFGRNQLLFNSELRFPLFDRIVILNPLVDIDLRGVRGALFFDAGDAWEDEPDIVGSFGLGARMNLGGYVVLRFDLAQTTDFRTVDPHWKWDIFFGWDF